MSVSGISSGVGLNQPDWRSTVKQGKQDFSQLLSALQSGDMSGAQQAYSAMQQLLPGFQAAAQAGAASSGSAAAGSAAAIGTDFGALGTALGSGSLSGAQDAIAKLQLDAQVYRQGQHQAGRAGDADADDQSVQKSSSGATNASAAAGANGTPSAFKADLASLSQALQSGNLTSAQDAFAKLQQDLPQIQQGQGAAHRHHHHHAASGAQSPLASYIANTVLGSAAPAAAGASTSVNVSA